MVGCGISHFWPVGYRMYDSWLAGYGIDKGSGIEIEYCALWEMGSADKMVQDGGMKGPCCAPS